MNASHQHTSNPSPQVIERHVDVAVVGGSAAGLAAALQLSRQRRSVIVIDSGEPRNAPASAMHSYLGHEGRSPADFPKDRPRRGAFVRRRSAHGSGHERDPRAGWLSR